MATRRQQLADTRYEEHRVKVCRDCGARYSTSSGSYGPTSHLKATGHSGFKTVKERRLKQPSRISYQPGYGPPRAS
jgi:hypothetical protein